MEKENLIHFEFNKEDILEHSIEDFDEGKQSSNFEHEEGGDNYNFDEENQTSNFEDGNSSDDEENSNNEAKKKDLNKEGRIQNHWPKGLPKRPTNAYMHFLNETIKNKKPIPEGYGGLYKKFCSDEWNNKMTEEDKKPYYQMFKNDQDEYRQKCNELGFIPNGKPKEEKPIEEKPKKEKLEKM